MARNKSERVAAAAQPVRFTCGLPGVHPMKIYGHQTEGHYITIRDDGTGVAIDIIRKDVPSAPVNVVVNGVPAILTPGSY